MNDIKKEATLQMLTIGRNALITAILALKIDFNIYYIEDLKDMVNEKIKDLKSDLKYE